MSDTLKQFNVRLSEAKHRKLKVKCAEEGVPLHQVIDELVSLYLDGKVKLPPKKERAKAG